MPATGEKPIVIPEGVAVQYADGRVVVRGPKGELSRALRPEFRIEIADGVVRVHATGVRSARQERTLRGTYAAHLRNMIRGVTGEFSKTLVVEGVGYRVQQEGAGLRLALGFSHPVLIPGIECIRFTVEKNQIAVSGADKEKVGQAAANIRAKKKPEPYKGKGIRYIDEVVRRKAGKKTAG